MAEASPACLASGDIGVAEMVPLVPVCIEAGAQCSALSRFVARDLENSVVAFGVVLSVESRPVVKRPGRLAAAAAGVGMPGV